MTNEVTSEAIGTREGARRTGGALSWATGPRGASGVRAVAAALGVAGMVFARAAHASFLPPELMDKAATYLAWFILVFMPIGGIVLFWLVHILPEKIAHKRHHPQRDAIQTLCLLSLVFGGMLWPLAWLWAFIRPVGYRMAYGTDKHEDYFDEMGAKALAGELPEHELAHLRQELETMADKGTLPARLRLLRLELSGAHVPPAGGAGSKSASAASDTKAGSV
jgi:Protein of unknown function (DUF3302)